MRESRVGCSPCRKRVFCASVPVPFAADLWTGVFSEVAIFVFFTEPPRLTGPRGESPDPDCFSLSTTVLHTGERPPKKWTTVRTILRILSVSIVFQVVAIPTERVWFFTHFS